jgi:hypothetical protein
MNWALFFVMMEGPMRDSRQAFDNIHFFFPAMTAPNDYQVYLQYVNMQVSITCLEMMIGHSVSISAK